MESTPYSNTSTPKSDVTAPGFDSPPGASKIGKAASSAHSAIDEAARKAQPSIDKAASMAHSATDKASAAAAQASDWLTEKTAKMSDAEKKLVANTCKYVGENPLKSVGMAVVVGALLARIL